jgi:hypothetical protein
VIIKSLSRKASSGGVIGNLFRYLFQEQKVTYRTPKLLFDTLCLYERTGKTVYVAGIRLAPSDVKYLLAEIEDAKLLSELKAFKGTVKEFITERLMAHNPEIAKQGKPLIITHNLRNRSLDGFIKEFERNEASRIHQRSDQTAVYHTILSWSNSDAEKITDAMLREMGKEYIRLRGDNNLFCAVKHAEVTHTHLHFLVSGTSLNGMSSRISKEKFAEIKKGMDAFQKERYPELFNSLPQHGKKEIDKEAGKNIKRIERTTVRESLLSCLAETYRLSTSTEHFLTQLKEQQIVPYERSGKPTGVTYEGYKFRFSRLEFDLEKLQKLDVQNAKAEKELQELQAIRAGKNEVEKQRETRLQSLSFEEITKTMNEDEKQNYVQELYSRSKEFEKHNAITVNEKTELQELTDIRSSRSSKDMEKDESKNESGRDMEDDRATDTDGISNEDTDTQDTTNDNNDEDDSHDIEDTNDDDTSDDDDDSPTSP